MPENDERRPPEGAAPDAQHDTVTVEARVRAALESVWASRIAAGAEYEAFEDAWRQRYNEYGLCHVPPAYRQSLRMMHKAGLTIPDLLEAVDETEGFTAGHNVRDHWAFFCARAWKKIRAIEDAAVELVMSGQESRP